MSRRGFTLIELLVVIAIIAILAAMLFPVFTKTKAKGQQTKCMNNMSQIGKALMMYSDDYNGNIPFSYNAPGQMNPWDKFTWRERIAKYIRGRSVLICPVPVYEWQANQWTRPGSNKSNVPHYGINRYLSRTDGISPEGYCNLSSIQIHSATILVSENRDGDWSAEPWDENGDNVGDGGFWPYHGDPSLRVGTFIFCDGHAAGMTVDRTQSTRNGVKWYYWKKIKKP